MKRTLITVMGFGILCLPALSKETAPRVCGVERINRVEFTLTGRGPSDVAAPKSEPSGIFSPLGHLAEDRKNPAEARLRKQRLISGLALAGSWVATLVVDLLYDDGYRRTTLIPVIGPFVTIARIEHDNAGYWPGAKPLLIVSGVAQTALATYFVISLVRHPKSDDAKSLTVWPSPNSINVRVQF